MKNFWNEVETIITKYDCSENLKAGALEIMNYSQYDYDEPIDYANRCIEDAVFDAENRG